MPKVKTTPSTYRLSPLTRRQLAELAGDAGESQAEALARLIDRAHVARFGEAQAPKDGERGPARL